MNTRDYLTLHLDTNLKQRAIIAVLHVMVFDATFNNIVQSQTRNIKQLH